MSCYAKAKDIVGKATSVLGFPVQNLNQDISKYEVKGLGALDLNPKPCTEEDA